MNDVKYVNDLLDERGHFLEWTQFSEKYDIHNQEFRYVALIHAIPRNWKKRIKDTGNKISEIKNQAILKLVKLKKPSKYFYTEQIKNTATEPCKALGKWEEIITDTLTENDRINM